MANETVLFKRGDSATITSTPVTDGQILFDTSGNGKMYLDNGTDRLEMGGAITVDASLSKTSTNAIQNKAVTGNILNSLAEVSAATQQNTIAGALALKEVNSSLTNVNVYVNEEDGKLHFVDATGADSVLPFSTASNYGTFTFDSSGNVTVNFGENPKEIVVLYGTKTSSYNLFSCYNEDYPSMNRSNNNFTKTDTGFTLNTGNSTAFAGAKGQYIWR